MNVLALDQLACIVGNVWDQRIFPVGTRKNQEYSVAQPEHKKPYVSNPTELRSKSLDFGIERFCGRIRQPTLEII